MPSPNVILFPSWRKVFRAMDENNLMEFCKCLESGALSSDGEAYGRATVLHYTISYRRNDMFLAMMERGAPIEYQNYYGNNALLTACWEGNFLAANALLEAGANPFVVNDNKRSALGICARGGVEHESIARLLIHQGLPVDFQVNLGITPAMEACMFLNPSMVQLFIEHGADMQALGRFRTQDPVFDIIHLLLTMYDADSENTFKLAPCPLDIRLSTIRNIIDRAILHGGGNFTVQDGPSSAHMAQNLGLFDLAQRLGRLPAFRAPKRLAYLKPEPEG